MSVSATSAAAVVLAALPQSIREEAWHVEN
jgi:hypothetical protein